MGAMNELSIRLAKLGAEHAREGHVAVLDDILDELPSACRTSTLRVEFLRELIDVYQESYNDELAADSDGIPERQEGDNGEWFYEFNVGGRLHRLTMWDAGWAGGRVAGDTHFRIGYRLSLFQVVSGYQTVFIAEDFNAPSSRASDSDANAAELLGFLSLRPGDTDSEYFDEYTDAQIAWRDEFAEDLGLLVNDWEEMLDSQS